MIFLYHLNLKTISHLIVALKKKEKLPFLDIEVSCERNKFVATVY